MMQFNLVVLFISCLIKVNVCQKRFNGDITMGESNDFCDNGKDNLEVDWDSSSDIEYACQSWESELPVTKKTERASCLQKDEIVPPIHHCMSDALVYTDQPPRTGPHRPLWPVYGEYLYCPPQRWVHSLEHGAAVFLYHPCANTRQIQMLKQVARSCLRRHIITPYRQLPTDTPLAVVTYGCRLLMSSVDLDTVTGFIKEHALQAPESQVFNDGQYNFGLLHAAANVSDISDSLLCPFTWM